MQFGTRPRAWMWLALLAPLPGCTSGSPLEAPPTQAHVTTADVSIDGVRVDEPDWRPDGANWELTLTWVEPGGVDLDHYMVVRNGVTVSDELREPAFVDEDVAPSSRYRYEVLGVDAEGARTEPGTLSLRTGSPGIAHARLQGGFVVRLRSGAFSGLQGTPRDLLGLVLVFDPACERGPCRVGFAIRGSGPLGSLARNGAVYSGTVHGPFYVRSCRGGSVEETLVVEARVRRAAAVAGRWQATAIDGSIEETAPASGCVTAHISWTFRGRSA